MKSRLLFISFVAIPVLAAHAGTGRAAVESYPFGAATPARYSAVSSAVMQYRWFKFPALGVITVDAPRRRFALVGLSQVGINVFELSETNGRLQSRMPGELLKRHPEIATGAAADVRQMFFDLDPARSARQVRGPRDKAAVFQQPAEGGMLEYRFDKKTGRLLEKQFAAPRKFFPGSSVVWRVLYEDYAAVGHQSYPRIIRFKHRNRHYAITLFLREMRIAR